ncbi:MAG: PHB depolymerase family esterase [Pseudomonadales bacterium]|nr:PHB depolymerase family esterase [Pseudomonadales bacterium]
MTVYPTRLTQLSLLALAAVSMVLSLTSAPTMAGQTYSYTLPQQAYSQSRARDYQVYVPDNLTTPAAMVMALHGCKQSNADVLADWGLTAAADQYGFVLVAPFITSYDGLRNENCWGFWFDHHRHQGRGEVEDLHQIGLAVEDAFAIDPERRYITGLSSGGAMAVVAATAHNEYWAAAAAASGLPYGEDAASVSLTGQCPGSASFHSVSQVASDMAAELDDDYPIPLMVLQNANDCTVLQTAANNIRDAHLQVFGSDGSSQGNSEASSTACSPYYQDRHQCQHTRYTENSQAGQRSLVETIFLDGPLATPNLQDTDHGHYWIGGEHGNNGKWSVRVGPSYPDIVWDFFDRHPKNGSTSGFPVITLIGNNPMTVNLGEPFTDPGATAEDSEDGQLSVTADCSDVDTTTVGDYFCTYSATDSADNTTTRERTVAVVDPNTPIETCEQATASPYTHIATGRAYAGGTSNLRAYASGDNIDIGGSFDTWSQVTLHEGVPGSWYGSEPAACGDDGNPGDTVCTDWQDTNLNHSLAGRAYYAGGYFSYGGDDYLGAVAGLSSWVRETEPGHYQSGQCP